MNYSRRFIKNSSYSVLSSVLLLSSASLVFAWTEPTLTPPSGNVSAPINTGATSQTKSGALTVSGALTAGSLSMTHASNGGALTFTPSNNAQTIVHDYNNGNTAGFGMNANGAGYCGALFHTGNAKVTWCNNGGLALGTYAATTNAPSNTLIVDNLGVGTSSPATTLSVAGTIYSSTGGFKFPDGTTQTTASGGSSQWTTSGSDIYYNTGNVGIGTASPGSLLDVTGSTPAITLSDSGAGAGARNWRFQSSPANWGSFAIQQSTTKLGSTYASKLSIDENGNVGIGTASPHYKLETSGSLGFNGGGYYHKALTSTNFGYSASYRALMIGDSGSTVQSNDNAVTIAFNYDPSINASGAFSGNGSEIIFRNGTKFITPNAANTSFNSNLTLKDGYVGIGTSAPLSKLHVELATGVTGTVDEYADMPATSRVTLANASALDDKVGLGAAFASSGEGIPAGFVLGREGSSWGSFVAIHTHPNDSVDIDAYPERVRITSDGNVGIGTSAPGSSAVTGLGFSYSAALHVAGSARPSPTFSGTGVDFRFIDTDASANVKAGDIVYDDQIFKFRGLTDAGAAENDPTLAIDVNTGSVGIGTASPNGMFVVGGGTASTYNDITFNGATTANYGSRLGFAGGGTEYAYLSREGRVAGGTSNNFLIRTSGATDLKLGTNGADNLTIQSGGNVGIGTTNPGSLLTVNGKTSLLTFTETISATGNSGAAATINFALGSVNTITLTANTTLSFSNATAGQSVTIFLKQDATGSRTVTWPTMLWSGGTAPTLTTTAAKTDIVTVFYDGTNYYGFLGGTNY